MVANNSSHNPKLVYTYVIIAWVVFVALVMTFGILNDVKESRENFREQGVAVKEAINQRVSVNQSILQGFSTIISVMGKLNHASIRQYARQMQVKYPHIFMFEIVDKVQHNNLQEFIETYRRLYPDFDIKTFDFEGDRTWKEANKNEYYLPIVFMEPLLRESRIMLGMNLEANELFRGSLLESMKTNKPAASVPFKLIEGPRAYLLHQPVINQEPGQITTDASFAMLVVRADSLIDKDDLERTGFVTTLYHENFNRKEKEGHLYHYKGPEKSSLEKLLFPLLFDERRIDSGIEKFILYRKMQMGWGDINWWLILVVFIVGLTSFWVLMFYAREYHTAAMKNLEATNRLFFRANHDSLTGLANKNLLDDRLKHALAQARRNRSQLAIFFLDLNDFKVLNDKFGHNFGDKVLKRVSERLRACIREEDTLARRSGDEFLVLVENLENNKEIDVITKKICNAFEQKFSVDSVEFEVGISIGTAIYPDQAESREALLQVADESMYEDKQRKQPHQVA